MNFKLLLLVLFFPFIAFSQSMTGQNNIQGINVSDPSFYPYETVVLDRIQYRDRVYSTSQKTELGDGAVLGMSLRYQKDKDAFTRFRFATDPSENRKNNETSNFEFIYNRRFKDFIFQIDLDLNTNDDSHGMNLGLDLDSDDTYISYHSPQSYDLTFFPFNFRTDVGDEFNTRDVTRISYIEGSPTTILASPANDEQFVSKTIPGFEWKYNLKSSSYFYLGTGVASYLYPTNGSYNIETNPVASSWEKKEVMAYKFGYLFDKANDIKISFQYVSQNNTKETGALIESASSLVLFKKVSKFHYKFEATSVKAGQAPLNLSRTTDWFEDVTLNRPVYSDIYGTRQDWIGKTDNAFLLKVGYRIDDVLSYVFYKYQGENFIYNGKESAHRLLVDDESKTHGGLSRIGIGSYFFYDNLFFNPIIEYQKAANPVFSNSTDFSSDRLQSSFKKENTIISFNVVYAFNGANLNPNWWF